MKVICAFLGVVTVVVSVCAAASAAPAVPPPEKAVVLDLKWLAPPAIAPDTSVGSAVKIADGIRLSTKPGSISPSFTWSLRYPIPASQYPVLVLRYRVSTIGFAEQPILQIEATRGAASFTANVIAASDLKQDGTVQEFRKSLTPLPDGSSYIRFHFALPPAVARLEVVELRLETAANSPTPAVPSPQTLEVAVVDEFNHGIADAEVRAGPLERSNWSAIARTDDTGRATLTVTPSPLPNTVAGTAMITQPIEVSVIRAGYVSQYAPSMQLPLSGPLLVRMAKVQRQAAHQPRQDQPDAANADQVPSPMAVQYPTNGYYTNDNYWNSGLYGGGWGYGYWPGGMWVLVINQGQNHDRDDGWHRHDRDLLTPAVPAPPLPPIATTPQPIVPVPTQLVTPMPTEGVVPMPTQGVVPMPTASPTPVEASGSQPIVADTPPTLAPPVPAPRRTDAATGRPILRGSNGSNAGMSAPVMPRASTPIPASPPRVIPAPQRGTYVPPQSATASPQPADAVAH